MFFNSDYNDLMPPYPEADAAPSEKTGLPRFLEILGGQCAALLIVNLLFLVGCIPVVTIPLSLFAMNRVVIRIVRDDPVRCVRDFGETFLGCWKQAYPAFLLTALPMGFAGYGMWFYLFCAFSQPLFLLPFLVCSTIFLVTLLSSGCLFGLLDSGKSLTESIRLALLLGVAKPVRTVPAALTCYGLLLLAVLFFPWSGLYLFLAGFSLSCLLEHFFLRIVLKPYLGGAKPSEPEAALDKK